jgi:uncharacterized membrane protein YkvA (DUF1232 family)
MPSAEHARASNARRGGCRGLHGCRSTGWLRRCGNPYSLRRPRLDPQPASEPAAYGSAVSTWSWIGIAFGIALATYVALVLTLLIAGRRTDARAWAGFVPDCAILFARLVKDPRVPRQHKILLALLVGYLSMPLDLIPDFIPVVGALDDAIIVAVVLRTLFRGAGPEVVREHWPGPQPSLDLMLRLAGAR